MVGGGKGTVFLIFKEPFDERLFFRADFQRKSQNKNNSPIILE